MRFSKTQLPNHPITSLVKTITSSAGIKVETKKDDWIPEGKREISDNLLEFSDSYTSETSCTELIFLNKRD